MLELAGIGTITSGSVMVPSPWFAALAAHPDVGKLDLGVHLTLTSESVVSRWRPVSTADPGSGLLDSSGHLWPTVPELRRHARPEAIEIEMRAQLDLASRAGIDVSHLDHHMGAALAPEFVERTVDLAIERRLPMLFPRNLPAMVAVLNLGEVDVGAIEAARRRAETAGVAVGDSFLMPLEHQNRTDYREVLEWRLSALPEGVTYLSLHCATPGDIESVHPRDAHWRLGEYEVFSNASFKNWMAEQPFRLAGMREFRDRLRA